MSDSLAHRLYCHRLQSAEEHPEVIISRDQLLNTVHQRQTTGTTGIYLIACGGAHFGSTTGSKTFDLIGPKQAAIWLRGRFDMRGSF